jgi:gliding motility-associated-like protein
VTQLTIDTVVIQTINLPATCGQVTYGGNTYTSSTTLNQTLQYQNGCDSINRTVNIIVLPVASFSQSPVRCLGQTFTAGSHTYNASGTYLDTIIGGAASGCDSIVTTNLTIISPISTASSLSGTCSITYKGQTYTSNASVIDTLTSQATGCDSIYNTVTITVSPVTTRNVNRNVCINTGQTYFAGGQNQSTAGVYLDTVRTPGGCDSAFVSTDLQVITPVVVIRHIDSCSRVSVNGVVYTADTVISYTLTSALGCDSITSSDTIRIHSPKTITITADQTLPLVEGDSTMLIIAPLGTYYNVVWTPDSNISSINSQSPTVAPKTSTTYSVAAVDSNNCSVSGSINITVTANTQNDFIMPTAFSPNGDGVNDLFKAILRNGATVTMFHIYNRWGELIYDKDRDNSDGWEGLYKNVAQPIGVYVYFISVKSVSGKVVTQEGNLTLLR